MSLTILIVDDDETARFTIGSFLTSRGYEVIEAGTLQEARDSLRLGKGDVILLDVQLPDGYGPNLLEETAFMPNRPPIILITGYGDIEMAVEAMKNGAHDFMPKPIKLAQLEKSIERAGSNIALKRELDHLRSQQRAGVDFIVGQTRVMQNVLEMAKRAAAASVSVLITGETGTGKEVLAQAIHKMGSRADKQFIAVNSAAIQPTVFESELFGHEAGAFTGADKRKNGLMETADNGILFLDEIASMPVDTQAKLLRALEERAIRRMGGTNMLRVDVQILAASNRHLPTLISEGKFREDLYYRLKVVDLHLPPLRERKEDIPDLVGLFIRQINPRLGTNITDVTPRAMDVLMRHRWPGNMRELRNVIERAILFCDEAAIDLPHLPSELSNGQES